MHTATMTRNEKKAIGGKGHEIAAAMWGGIRKRTRDRTGEVIDEEPAVHGKPELPRTARIDRIRERFAPIELDDAELAYLEAYDLAEAYPDQIDQLRDAIDDAASGRRAAG